jgi:hypothetical protein
VRATLDPGPVDLQNLRPGKYFAILLSLGAQPGAASLYK